MPATFTVTSGSERVVHVYPDRTERTSSGSASRSRVSSRSITSSDESWSEIDEDDIDPSDSASRGQPTSRRHNTEARPAPARRASSRRVVLPAERERERQREELPPRRHSSRRQHVSRHDSHESRTRRSSSRRVPSDESSSTVASSDDYPPQPPYGHPGAMRRDQYPQSGYRHVPAGYPPSMTSGGAAPYPDPYAPHQALVHTQRHDPFGYPQQPNPFGPQGLPSNPFSPISSQDSSSYFAADPMGPPPRPHRPDGPQRPQSFVAPPSHYGSEMMMAPYHPQPYGPYAGMPYPPYGPPMHGWSPPPQAAASPPPPAPAPAPAVPPPPPEKNAEIEALKDMLKIRIESDDHGKKAKHDEIESLKKMLSELEAKREKREKEWAAIREAEAAARAAEKARIEEEKKRQAELADARKKAKEDAESKAAEAAKKAKDEHEAAVKKAKDEHDAKLAEAEKAKAELEAAKKALEEDIAKNKPTPDSQKAPIKFKDAVGRKFSFPWHICKTWKGMETLIKQAFLHVDQIGDHVHAGHYDLTGPDGEIILPQVWDTMIQPDWEISMHLWPIEEEKPPPPDLPVDFSHLGLNDFMGMPGDGGKKKPSKKDGKKAKKPSSPEPIMVPPMHHGSPPQGFGDPFQGMMFPPGISPVMEMGEKKKVRPKSKSMKSREVTGLAAWFAGAPPKPSKKEDEKLEILVRPKKVHPSSRNGAPQTMHDQAQCLVM